VHFFMFIGVHQAHLVARASNAAAVSSAADRRLYSEDFEIVTACPREP
jgi:hypothetical protein